MDVATTLGVNLIWIDSLCIAQDSQSDWETESAKMGAIYSNCCCTICADVWGPSSEGLFRRDVSIAHSAVHFACRFGNQNEGQQKHGTQICIMKRQSEFHELRLASILHTRGWTMQEEELSPRLLIFTEEQILWTCRTFRACEGHPAKHVEHQSSKIGHPPRLLDHGSNLAKSNAYDMWFRTVQDYTDRGLTNSKDTMPALGGLASILHRYIDATYVAGIWSDDLARGLAWTVRRARSLEQQKPWCARHETYIAPSWSWAAISGVASFEAVRATKEEVRNQARKYGPAIIHTFNLELATLDPFGRIASAELYITAPVFHGVMGHDHDRGTNEVHNRHGIDLREDNKDYFGRLYVDVSTERDTMTYVDCIFLFSQ
jgi:hypothetical protein